MARLLMQVFENTSTTMQTMHSTVTKVHTMAEKGMLTRAYSGIDPLTVGYVVIAVCALALILLVALYTWHALDNRRIARIRANSYAPYMPDNFSTDVDAPNQTLNMKGQ